MFVVTGGGTGIGRALAYALTERGYSVFIVGRREPLLIETAQYSPLIKYICADVATHEGRLHILERLAEVDQLFGLIHNAGVIEPIMPLREIDENAWGRVMATNVNAPLFLSQLLYEKLINGRVLHIGSGAAYFPVMGWSAYCVSKAALALLNRSWQLESSDVSFSCVMPGIIDTDMQAKIRQASFMDKDKLDFFKHLKEDKRLVSTDTVALFLSWLLVDVDKETYVSKEWDIYDKSHHREWLVPPHKVPAWE